MPADDDVDCDGFEVETLINVRVAKAGLAIAEVPSFEQERIHGVSQPASGPGRARVLRTILRERIRREVSGTTLFQATFRELPAERGHGVVSLGEMSLA